MKLPHIINTYCPFCKRHNKHEIEKVKKKKASELRQGQRRFRRVTAGYRGFPRSKPEGREKPTKRAYIRYRCITCKRVHQRSCIRTKRFELIE